MYTRMTKHPVPGRPMDPTWRGIIINAPSRVYIPADGIEMKDKVIFGIIPIGGYSRVESLKTRRADPEIIVAEDIKSNKKLSAQMINPKIDLEIHHPISLLFLMSN